MPGEAITTATPNQAVYEIQEYKRYKIQNTRDAGILEMQEYRDTGILEMQEYRNTHASEIISVADTVWRVVIGFSMHLIQTSDIQT